MDPGAGHQRHQCLVCGRERDIRYRGTGPAYRVQRSGADRGPPGIDSAATVRARVAAHLVKKRSGFKVIYGPIKSTDLPLFLDAGLKATPEMRLKTFNIRERTVLIPVELVSTLKWVLIMLPLFFFVGGLGGQAGFLSGALHYGLFAIIALLSAVIAGAVLTPILLPWLPGRAFSLKGMAMGLITAVILTALRPENFSDWQGRIETLAWFLLIPAIAAYLAMNFTGASTYTSLSGVKKEMKWAVPLEIAAGAAGLFLWLGSLFVI